MDEKKLVTNAPTVYYNIIAENVARLRGKMSQVKLGTIVGVSRGTINRIEKGHGCRLDLLIKIAEALDVKPQDLFLSSKRREEISYEASLIWEKFFDRIKQQFPLE